MILADSSVWIDYFNGIATVHTDTLDMKLDDGEVVMGDLILLEILQGFRSNRDYNRARTTLAVLDQYEMFGLDMVVKCADNYRGLRKKGITIRKTVDVIIATFCVENKFPLLYSDRDFTPFVENMGLKVLNET